MSALSIFFFFFNDTATTEIYTLSLHDALPISAQVSRIVRPAEAVLVRRRLLDGGAPRQVLSPDPLPRSGSPPLDRKSTRLNSSHANISYAVFCLKKKKKNQLTSLNFSAHTLPK